MSELPIKVREYMQSMGFTEYDKTTDAFYKAKPTYAEGGVGGKWSIDRDIAEQLYLTQQVAMLDRERIYTLYGESISKPIKAFFEQEDK